MRVCKDDLVLSYIRSIERGVTPLKTPTTEIQPFTLFGPPIKRGMPTKLPFTFYDIVEPKLQKIDIQTFHLAPLEHMHTKAVDLSFGMELSKNLLNPFFKSGSGNEAIETGAKSMKAQSLTITFGAPIKRSIKTTDIVDQQKNGLTVIKNQATQAYFSGSDTTWYLVDSIVVTDRVEVFLHVNSKKEVNQGLGTQGKMNLDTEADRVKSFKFSGDGQYYTFACTMIPISFNLKNPQIKFGIRRPDFRYLSGGATEVNENLRIDFFETYQELLDWEI